MPVSYDFKSSSRNTPDRRRKRAKRLRFFGVLLIVAAITIAVVMVIVPDKNPPKNTSSTTDDDQQESSTSGGDTSGGGTQSDGDPSSGSSGNSGDGSSDSGSSGNSGNGSSDSGSSGNSGNGSSGNTGGASGSSNTDPNTIEDWYRKGQTVPGGDAGNTPVYQSNQAPGATSVLAKLKSAADPDEIISLATDFLMKEYSAGGCYSTNWHKVGSYLTAARHTKFASGNLKNCSIVHKVAAGNNLSKIAHRYHTTVEGLKKINNKKNSFLRIGERLTVIPGKWRITISKKAHTLNLWRQSKSSWQIFAVFPVGIGRKNSTPTGKFNISHRLYHPRWHGPDGRIFAYGDKENPLGESFLKLRGSTARGHRGRQGYGIHGSPDDNSVGKALSRGCIRMHNNDVLLLYYLVPVTTPVEITD